MQILFLYRFNIFILKWVINVYFMQMRSQLFIKFYIFSPRNYEIELDVNSVDTVKHGDVSNCPRWV